MLGIGRFASFRLLAGAVGLAAYHYYGPTALLTVFAMMLAIETESLHLRLKKVEGEASHNA